ncbi:DEAD/DEAH box helicase [Candidatus Clostridium stratigraminis]|uniref:DEAD/DEAH box helicase n=1 Tax=Candidatus Clostridium stratigraminis TaxID=3381661 RepID=A0ABW8T102_9CLOT
MLIPFDDLGLNSNLINGLKKENIFTPTEIQEKVIPIALKNKDIIGQSQTGSGKTLAYLLPIFQRIEPEKREMHTIILAPTHELVMQIDKVIKTLAEDSNIPITSLPIIGDVNIKRQAEKLREKPHIIVGSTVRILELIKAKKISAHTIKTIVIDEADRLLNEKNLETVKDIIKTTLRDRQLMLFSATIDASVIVTAQNLMKESEVIRINNNINSNIEHMYVLAEQRDKMEVLRKIIAAEKPNKAIVFINKSEETEITTLKLRYHHFKVYGIHGKATKEERQRAMEDFRNGKLQILVASDLAARGLDIKEVTHIINLDLPEHSKDYLHRVGRTGRATKSGKAISIVTQKELSLIKKYEKEFNISVASKEMHLGSLITTLTNKVISKKKTLRIKNY